MGIASTAYYNGNQSVVGRSRLHSAILHVVQVLRLLRDVVNFCYPGVCAACRAPCEPAALLCPPCDDQLKELETAGACERCGSPVARDGAPCPFCLGGGVPHYECILRLGTFDEPLKELIHQFKYQGRHATGERLAARLLARDRVRQLVADADVLVPVPLHRWRQFRRGYNQAAVVAHIVAKHCGKPIVRPIARVRNTPSQTNLHAREKRFANLRGAFRLVNPMSIGGQHVLVIDDVTTSGATLQTVARALQPAHPASLTALVLAVADPRGRGFRAV